MELGNAEAIKKLVGAGLGLSLASAMAVAAEVKAGALSAIPLSPPLARRLALIRRRDKPDTPALRVVLRRPRHAQAKRHGPRAAGA